MDHAGFRELMATVCGPVTVVTTSVDNAPHGTTVSAIMSLSLAPPMIAVSLDRSSTLLARIVMARRFAVNALAQGQDALAMAFAKKGGSEKFDGITWMDDHGMPRFPNVSSWMVCDLEREVDAGDHVLLFGHVTHGDAQKVAPLIYGHRQFGTHSAFHKP